MRDELVDFLRFCVVERRLAPLTCAAYERDVLACLGYLEGQGFDDLAEVRPTAPARVPRREREAPAAGAVEPGRATAALKSFFGSLVDGASSALPREGREDRSRRQPTLRPAWRRGAPASDQPDTWQLEASCA
jgi:site-specific recombinase XerD